MKSYSGINPHCGIKLTACAAALALAFPAVAQEKPAKPGEIQEVVITASKRKESIQSVAMSVDAVTAETLQKLNVNQFADVEKLSPGLVLNAADGRGQNVSLRGVAFDPDTGADPTVQIYWNETPISTSDAFRSMFDIGRIEVLRGPQGTLRGQTSPAGAITVATRLPVLDSIEGTISQTWGSNRLWNTQAAVNVPLIEGKLAVRVAGVYDRSENDVHNVANGRSNGDRARGGRVSVLYQPLANLELQLVHQQLTDRNVNYPVAIGAPVSGQANGLRLTADDRQSVVEGNYDFYNRAKLTSLNATWSLDGHKLSYIGGAQQGKEIDDRDLDITNVLAGFSYGQQVNITSRQRTHELRFESTGDRAWNYMVGMYYSKTKGDSSFSQPYAYFYPVPYGPPMFVPIKGFSAPGTFGRSTALFTDHRFAVTNNDTIEVGARLQKNRAYSQQYLDVFGEVSASLPEQLATQDTRHWTGSASYKRTFNKNLMAYLSYAGGYRPGGAVGFVTAPGLDPSFITYKPEKTNSIELGMKSTWLDRRLTLNANIFQQEVKDYIARANGVSVRTTAVAGEPAGPGPGGTYPADIGTGGINLNTNGDVIVRGLEATAIWSILPNWRAQLAVSYVNAHYDNALLYCSDSNNDGIPDIGDHVQPGRQVSLCPSNRPLADMYGNEAGKLSLTLQSEYSRELGNTEGFVRGLVRYAAPGHNVALNKDIASFTPLDIYVGLRDPGLRWEVSLWSQNVFNRSVDRGATPSFQGGLSGGYMRVATPEQRKVGVTLRYNFDS